MHLVNGTGNSPSLGRPTPGVVKQDTSSRGTVDTNDIGAKAWNVQWREASRRRQRQTNQHHGLVPTPPPPPHAHFRDLDSPNQPDSVVEVIVPESLDWGGGGD